MPQLPLAVARIVFVLVLAVLVGCGPAQTGQRTAASPREISVVPADFTTELITCSQSAQIDDYAAATRQVLRDWSSLQSSGAVTGWIQAVAPDQRGCNTFFNGQYAPNNQIAYSAVIQFKDSVQAAHVYAEGFPVLNLSSGPSGPGTLMGSQNGLGPNSTVLAHTDYNEWEAFWQHSSFLVEFSAINFGDTEAKKAAAHLNDRIPDVAPTPSPLAPRPSPAADCRDILALAPAPESPTPSTTRTERLILAGNRNTASIDIQVPSDLTTSGGQVKSANSLLALGPASGFYPQVTVEFFQHKGTLPNGHSLAVLEAASTERDLRVKIIPPVVVGLLGLVEGTPGRIDICLKPDARLPDPRTVVIQFLFPRPAGPGAWDEFLLQVITTVDRYQYDSRAGYATARSVRFH